MLVVSRVARMLSASWGARKVSVGGVERRASFSKGKVGEGEGEGEGEGKQARRARRRVRAIV